MSGASRVESTIIPAFGLSRRSFLAGAAVAPLIAKGAAVQKGVNFTAERPDIYDSPKAAELLGSLPAYGINAVALVPYGFTRPGTPEVRFGGQRMWERDDAIEKMSAVARAAGMSVLLKPQIWVGGSYPAALWFDKPEDRTKWMESYLPFAEHYATLATRIRASLYCVGTEFARMSKEEKAWRGIVRAARTKFRGPVTYAATQGEEFEQLSWWDAVDFIGLNNYYPLPDSLDTRAMVAKVEAVQARYSRPVIFPEAGYSSVSNANREPWAENQGPVSMEMQARCYEALLAAFTTKPWFAGVYWWKVGSNGKGGSEDRTHTPWNKPAMEVVKRWYRKQWQAEGTPPASGRSAPKRSG
jgi:hypothetical protein